MKKGVFIAFLLGAVILSMSVFCGAAEMASMEVPGNLTAEKTVGDAGKPFILLRFDVPEPVRLLAEKGLNNEADLCYEVECRIGRGDWENVGTVHFSEGAQLAITGADNAMDFQKELYSFRVRFAYFHENTFAKPVYSLYSKMVHIGNKKYLGAYQKASPWAAAELDRALEYGFIPEKIRNQMDAPATREELCEVIMALYESMAGKASAKASNIFSDTANPQIYQAYALGIVSGVGQNRFDPDANANREQTATMIYRTIKALLPQEDFSTKGVESFIDESDISSWALSSVKFMNKNGLLKGSNGMMNPKGITTREQAVLIAVRTYEKFAANDEASGLEAGNSSKP